MKKFIKQKEKINKRNINKKTKLIMNIIKIQV